MSFLYRSTTPVLDRYCGTKTSSPTLVESNHRQSRIGNSTGSNDNDENQLASHKNIMNQNTKTNDYKGFGIDVDDDDDDDEVVVAKVDTTTSDHASSGLVQKACESFLCDVCLELQAESTILVPCGHSFCAACVKNSILTSSTAVCPTCRSTVTTTVLNRVVNTALEGLSAVIPDAFEATDLQMYRSKTNTDPFAIAASIARSASKSNKAGGGQQRTTSAFASSSIAPSQPNHKRARTVMMATGAPEDPICID